MILFFFFSYGDTVDPVSFIEKSILSVDVRFCSGTPISVPMVRWSVYQCHILWGSVAYNRLLSGSVSLPALSLIFKVTSPFALPYMFYQFAYTHTHTHAHTCPCAHVFRHERTHTAAETLSAIALCWVCTPAWRPLTFVHTINLVYTFLFIRPLISVNDVVLFSVLWSCMSLGRLAL